MMQEKPIKAISGGLVLLALLAGLVLGIAWLVLAIRDGDVWMILASALFDTIAFILLFGLFVVNPNEARVLQLFGRYVGTVRDPRASLGQSALFQAADLGAGAKLRN